MFVSNYAVWPNNRGVFVLYGPTWLRQDCARPAIASDFFQKSLAQGLYNDTLGKNLPVSETTHQSLGGDKGILKALVDDVSWKTIRGRSPWDRYVDYAEARAKAADLKSQLVGKVVTETDLAFGWTQTYTVTSVASEGSMVKIRGIGQDQSEQSWSGNVKVLTTSSSGGQLFISNLYGSSLVADFPS